MLEFRLEWDYIPFKTEFFQASISKYFSVYINVTLMINRVFLYLSLQFQCIIFIYSSYMYL